MTREEFESLKPGDVFRWNSSCYAPGNRTVTRSVGCDGNLLYTHDDGEEDSNRGILCADMILVSKANPEPDASALLARAVAFLLPIVEAFTTIEHSGGPRRDDESCIIGHGYAKFTYGHMRAARAFLAEIDAGEVTPEPPASSRELMLEGALRVFVNEFADVIADENRNPSSNALGGCIHDSPSISVAHLRRCAALLGEAPSDAPAAQGAPASAEGAPDTTEATGAPESGAVGRYAHIMARRDAVLLGGELLDAVRAPDGTVTMFGFVGSASWVTAELNRLLAERDAAREDARLALLDRDEARDQLGQARSEVERLKAELAGAVEHCDRIVTEYQDVTDRFWGIVHFADVATRRETCMAWIDRLFATRDAARAEVESLRAQLIQRYQFRFGETSDSCCYAAKSEIDRLRQELHAAATERGALIGELQRAKENIALLVVPRDAGASAPTATPEGLARKLAYLSDTLRGCDVPSDLVVLCVARMTEGHRLHGDDVSGLDCRAEVDCELADIPNYLALDAMAETPRFTETQRTQAVKLVGDIARLLEVVD